MHYRRDGKCAIKPYAPMFKYIRDMQRTAAKVIVVLYGTQSVSINYVRQQRLLHKMSNSSQGTKCPKP
jgi:hypothetical protein